MILYHVVTLFQLESCIVHKLRYHSCQKADILVSVDIPTELINKLGLSEYGLFEKIGVIHNGGIVLTTKNEDACSILNDVDTYEKIYVGGCHYGFGKMLVENEICFSVFEEACGVMCKPERLAGIVERLSKDWFDCVNSMGLIDASNPYIEEKLCSLKHQCLGFEDEKAIDFNVATEIGKLSEDQVILLKDIFDTPKTILVPNNSALILTQHFANLTIMTWDEQKLIYTLLVDYFLDNYYLIFKTHPYDLMYYDELFDNCQVIRERFPAELLPYILSDKPECVATVNSTAIKGIDSLISKNLCFDINFETEFMKLHKYFVAMEYCFQNVNQEYLLCSYNANKSIIDNFNKVNDYGFSECQELTLDIWPNDGKKRIIFTDNINFETFDEFVEKISGIDENVICVFIGILPIDKGTKWDDLIHAITISVFDNNGIDYEEVIYIYAKGELSKMNDINKKLSNSHIEISAEEKENDKRRIKILEGILEATEKRLAYYIEKDKEIK